ncbi:MAG: shikimate dehydrogenase [Sphaerochaeta sp.]|nr:shikimate dehydrogenase [Sphaerochaeta sp.]
MEENTALHALMKGPLPPLYFCIGDPVVGNPTEHMVDYAFKAMGYPGRYLTCRVTKEELAPALWGLRALGFAGGNVTAPHKQHVLQYLDDMSESALLCKAVNTITRKGDGTYYGDNTDGKGFLQSLQDRNLQVKDKKVVIIGSGGAASAIAVELVLAKAGEVVLVNRTEERSRTLAKRLSGISSTVLSVDRWVGTYTIPSDTDIVVQATSVGLFSPLACVDVTFGQQTNRANTPLIACDVVFNPVRTLFIQRAQEAGCTLVDGLGMLVNQGRLGIQGWTGKDPDREGMRCALEEAFEVE